jgi:DnaJ family protein C protein 3
MYTEIDDNVPKSEVGNVTFHLLLAIHDYQMALQLDEHYSRAKEGMQHAQKLQKRAERRDYYKILGVSRNANKKDIIKAYR